MNTLTSEPRQRPSVVFALFRFVVLLAVVNMVLKILAYLCLAAVIARLSYSVGESIWRHVQGEALPITTTLQATVVEEPIAVRNSVPVASRKILVKGESITVTKESLADMRARNKELRARFS